MNKKSSNVVWEQSLVTRHDREMLNGHRSFVMWFTGLSGSGKSTLAHAVEKNSMREVAAPLFLMAIMCDMACRRT